MRNVLCFAMWQGGESGVFTPMHLLVFRKPPSDKPASYADAVKADAD